MKKLSRIQETGVYIGLIALDIFIIQLFRHLTPVIVWLRLGFIFVVISSSIYLFYVLVKPEKPFKAGVFYGILSFMVALTESYLVHVIIEKGHYRPLYLLPSSFALLLPVLLAAIYRVLHPLKPE
jgi:hypothetical protein